jgi:hypothetical protein
MQHKKVIKRAPQDFDYYQKPLHVRKRDVEINLKNNVLDIPCVIESCDFNLNKKKYIFSRDFEIGQVLHIIRLKEKLKPEEACFLFINGKVPKNNDSILQLYNKEKCSEDDILYIFITKEMCFGSNDL